MVRFGGNVPEAASDRGVGEGQTYTDGGELALETCAAIDDERAVAEVAHIDVLEEFDPASSVDGRGPRRLENRWWRCGR